MEGNAFGGQRFMSALNDRAGDVTFPTGMKLSTILDATQGVNPTQFLNNWIGKKGGATQPGAYDPSDQSGVPTAPPFGAGGSPMGSDARANLLRTMAMRGRGGSIGGPGGQVTVSPGVNEGDPMGPPVASPTVTSGPIVSAPDPMGQPSGAPPPAAVSERPPGVGAPMPGPGVRPDLMNRLRSLFAGA